MKLKVTTALLKSALERCNPILSAKPTLPAMSCALFEASGTQLRITVTNMDQRITAKIEADIAEDGKICISFKRLFDWVKSVSGEVSMQVKDSKVSLKCGNFVGSVNCLSADQFPPKGDAGDSGNLISDKDGAISSYMRRVKPAVSSEQSRYILNGVHLKSVDGKLTLEASDGRRGHQIATPIKADADCVVPTPACDAIVSMFEETASEITIYENRIEVISETTEFESKLIEGNFPDFSRIIPAPAKRGITVDRSQMLEVIKRLSSIQDNEFRIYADCSKTGIYLTSKVADEFSGETIEGKQKHEMKFSVNGNFLKDVLNNVSESEIFIEQSDDRSPLVVREDGFIGIVMPMFQREDDK